MEFLKNIKERRNPETYLQILVKLNKERTVFLLDGKNILELKIAVRMLLDLFKKNFLTSTLSATLR